MKKFAPLALGLIEEGVFLANVDTDLQDLSKEMIRYIERHGCEKSEGIKAELTIKVSLKADDPSSGDFSIKTSISKKMPGRPSGTSRAIQDREDDGKPTLFVRTSGSDDVNPRQMKLATNDGRGIDLETGKAIEPKPAAPHGPVSK